jgi:hypothetical protein
MTKNYQQTPKQRRLQNQKVEKAKRQIAHSTPLFNPGEPDTSRKKVGGVPVVTLDNKQHNPVQGGRNYRFW